MAEVRDDPFPESAPDNAPVAGLPLGAYGLADLRVPFRRDQISKLKKRYKDKNGEWHEIELDYVGHADITARLLDVDPEWNWRPAGLREDGTPVLVYDKDGSPIGLWISLTVCGITRLGYGSCEGGKPDAIKELIGDCLVADTLVETESGPIPVQDLGVGDLVFTRDGLRAVTDVWEQPTGAIMEVTLADGTVIAGTPHHRLFLADGSISTIAELRKGDKLAACRVQPACRVRSRSTLGTSSAGTPTGVTTRAGSENANFACIGGSTNRPTARCRQASTSTTATAIPATTISRTSSHWTRPTTCASTQFTIAPSASPARGADRTSWPLCAGRNGVRRPAKRPLGGRLGWIASSANALSAGGHSRANGRAPLVRVRPSAPVISVRSLAPAASWDVTVDGNHEFVANGLLSHNSIRNAAMRFGCGLELWSKTQRVGYGEPEVARPPERPYVRPVAEPDPRKPTTSEAFARETAGAFGGTLEPEREERLASRQILGVTLPGKFTLSQARNHVLNFGKYKGQTLGALLDGEDGQGMSWIDWIAQKTGEELRKGGRAARASDYLILLAWESFQGTAPIPGAAPEPGSAG